MYLKPSTIFLHIRVLKIELLYVPAISLLAIYPKALIQKDICTSIFITALFVLAKIWKQPKCSSTERKMKKM